MVQLSHPYMTTGETIALNRWTFFSKGMSLLFNMLSRLVITFLPRNKSLLISWLQSPSAVILEKTLESPFDRKEVNPKGNQPWIFYGRTDAETPILWPPDMKSQFTGKDSDAGKDWRQEEKQVTEDQMVGWHHWFNGHEFEEALGDSEGQGSLACCVSCGHKESDMT